MVEADVEANRRVGAVTKLDVVVGAGRIARKAQRAERYILAADWIGKWWVVVKKAVQDKNSTTLCSGRVR